MAVIPFSETIEHLAEDAWGSTSAANDKAAVIELLANPSKMTGLAVIELIRRFNKFVNAMVDERDDCLRKAYLQVTKPDNAKAFPDKSPGDFLWHGELEDGFSKSVVVARDEEGFLLIVRADDLTAGDYQRIVQYANGYYSESLEHAIRTQAEGDIAYMTPRLKLAKQALAAVKAKAPLEKYVDGFDFDQEGTTDEPR